MSSAKNIKVAILDDYQQIALSLAPWSKGLPQAEVVSFRDHIDDDQVLTSRLLPYGVVIAMRERTPFTRDRIAALPNLRLLITTGRRNASIDLAAARDYGITVCGTDSLPWPAAELTWGLILALLRHIPAEDAAIRRGAWQHTVGVSLHGKTLGVLGLGRLGRQVARVGTAFGMRVVAWSPSLTAEAAADSGAERVDRDELFRESDVVTVHAKLSVESRGCIGAAELRAMKPSAYVVNTSRGPLIDEDALVQALREGWIAGAGLDVFDREPLPPNHPLLESDRTVLTPHIGYVTEEAYEIYFCQALENIQAFQRGQPVRQLADKG